MALVEIAPPAFDVFVDLRYATADNLTGKPIYRRASCYLHRHAAERLLRATQLAAPLGYKLYIFDAYRPPAAQWALWNHLPNPDFIADPRRGSPVDRLPSQIVRRRVTQVDNNVVRGRGDFHQRHRRTVPLMRSHPIRSLACAGTDAR